MQRVDRAIVFNPRWKSEFTSSNELLQLFDAAQDVGETVNLVGRSDANEAVERLRAELLHLLLSTAHRQG